MAVLGTSTRCDLAASVVRIDTDREQESSLVSILTSILPSPGDPGGSSGVVDRRKLKAETETARVNEDRRAFRP